ncbi:MAG: helix-turn-helix domain-containing protein [Shimia sp.]
MGAQFGHRGGLGADLRALRKSRGMTLQELASKVERSVGWLSQAERDLSAISVDDVRALARCLDVAPASLLRSSSETPREAGLVVRRSTRRPIGNRVPGMTEALLSPDLTDAFEMLHCVFDPGSQIITPVQRATQEVAHITKGKLDIWIDGAKFTIGEGDSFRTKGQSFRWANPYAKACTAIWVIAPPVY